MFHIDIGQAMPGIYTLLVLSSITEKQSNPSQKYKWKKKNLVCVFRHHLSFAQS